MAKKKNDTAFIGGGDGTTLIGVSDSIRPRTDNNPDSGLCPKPNEELNGCRNPRVKKHLCEAIAAGESANRPDVFVQTPNGVSSSFGKGKNRQYNWGDGSDGSWNDNDFTGGNMTGQ
jgi:hypothetical protein